MLKSTFYPNCTVVGIGVSSVQGVCVPYRYSILQYTIAIAWCGGATRYTVHAMLQMVHGCMTMYDMVLYIYLFVVVATPVSQYCNANANANANATANRDTELD